MKKIQVLGLTFAAGLFMLGGSAGAQTPPSSTGTGSSTYGSSTSSKSGMQSTTTTSTTSGTTASTSTTGELKGKDASFIKKTADNNTAEIEMAKVGADKADSSEVKTFAQKMVDDHGKADTELKSLASSKSVDVSAAASKSHDHNSLENKAGADFDKAFMKMMVSDHKKVVRQFESEAKNGKDPDVKAFAEKMLPTLRDHLNEAQNIYNGLKGTKSTTDTTGTRTTTKSSS